MSTVDLNRALRVVMLSIGLMLTMPLTVSAKPYPGGPTGSQTGSVDSPSGIWLGDHFDFRLEGDGDEPGDDPFTSVDFAGDWNNDGVGDYVVGRWNHGAGGDACIIFGKKTHLTKESSSINRVSRACFYGSSGEDLGSSVAGGLDVGGPTAPDGKPIPDVVVGGIDIGSGSPGGAYVIYGQDCQTECAWGKLTSDFNGEGWVRYRGNDEWGGDAGASVSMTPDMNDDGLAEVIVGDPDYDLSEASSECDRWDRLNCGAAWVVFGGSKGGTLNSAPGFRIDGSHSEPNHCKVSITEPSSYSNAGICVNGNAGQSVAGGGDINGDGKGDVVIGSPDDYANESGSASIVFGKSDEGNLSLGNHSSRSVVRISGAHGGCGAWSDGYECDLGYTVAIAPDMNGDGRDEAVVANPKYGAERGSVHVIFGQERYEDALVQVDKTGDWGFTVVGANDDDGDMIGAGGLAGAGDFNNDGRGDLIVGGPGSDEVSPDDTPVDAIQKEDNGAVWVVFGQAEGGRIDLSSFSDRSKFLRIEGESGASTASPLAGDEFGGNYDDYDDYYTHMIAAGDVNADGAIDILGSAPWWDSGDGEFNNAGAVYTLLGSSISYSGDKRDGKSFRAINLPCGKPVKKFGPTHLIGYAGPDDSRTIGTLEGKALPDGLQIDAKTGVISGTPTTAGTSALYKFALHNDYTTSTAVSTAIVIRVKPAPGCAPAVEEPDPPVDPESPIAEDPIESEPLSPVAPLQVDAVQDEDFGPGGGGTAPNPVANCSANLKLGSSRSVRLAKRLKITLRGPKQLRASNGSARVNYRILARGKQANKRLGKLVRMVRFTLGAQRLTSDAIRPFTTSVHSDLEPGTYRLKATVIPKKKHGQKKIKKRVLSLSVRVLRSCK